MTVSGTSISEVNEIQSLNTLYEQTNEQRTPIRIALESKLQNGDGVLMMLILVLIQPIVVYRIKSTVLKLMIWMRPGRLYGTEKQIIFLT